MNRREMFRFLPLAVGLAVPLPALAKQASKEDSPWVYFTCRNERWDDAGKPYWACRTEFKFVRGTDPMCPKCGSRHWLEREEYMQKMTGIEIKP